MTVAIIIKAAERIVDYGKDRKSTRLNSSHQIISYAVFCLKKKNAPGPQLISFFQASHEGVRFGMSMRFPDGNPNGPPLGRPDSTPDFAGRTHLAVLGACVQ